MINLMYADAEGELQFELIGADADALALLLRLPLKRRSPYAGIIVTIVPRDLTNDEFEERIKERGDGSDYSDQLSWLADP
jgi:hypothetical protein